MEGILDLERGGYTAAGQMLHQRLAKVIDRQDWTSWRVSTLEFQQLGAPFRDQLSDHRRDVLFH